MSVGCKRVELRLPRAAGPCERRPTVVVHAPSIPGSVSIAGPSQADFHPFLYLEAPPVGHGLRGGRPSQR